MDAMSASCACYMDYAVLKHFFSVCPFWELISYAWLHHEETRWIYIIAGEDNITGKEFFSAKLCPWSGCLNKYMFALILFFARHFTSFPDEETFSSDVSRNSDPVQVASRQGAGLVLNAMPKLRPCNIQLHLFFLCHSAKTTTS